MTPLEPQSDPVPAEEAVPDLPPTAPTVVTLHMPSPFTATFAQRLDKLCAPSVTEATDGAAIVPGHIFLAPGGAALAT